MSNGYSPSRKLTGANTMTKSALIYAWTVIAIGIAILASASFMWQSTNGTAFGMCLALALFASTRKVKLPELTGTLTPGFVFLLVAVATLSWTETVVIAVASGLMQSLWRPKSRPTALQVAFSAATMAIAGALTFGVTSGLVAVRGADSMTLAVAGVVLLVTNTLIVSTIVCLIKEAPFYTAWRSLQARMVPYYLAGGMIANIWSQTESTATIGLAVVAAISVYLLSVCYRELDQIAYQGACA